MKFNKESLSVSAVIAIIIAAAFLLATVGAYDNFIVNYDTMKNIFLSCVVILLAIVFVENTKKLVITCGVFSGIFISTGLHLIWAA